MIKTAKDRRVACTDMAGINAALGMLAWLLMLASGHSYAEDDVPLELQFVEVQAGIFVHFGKQQVMSADNRGDIANIGFVIGENSIAVIDPGGSPEIGHMMRRAIASTSSLPISHVILTHAHPDHIFGGSAFSDVPLVIAHKRFRRALVQRGVFYRDSFKRLFTDTAQVTSLLPNKYDFDTLDIDLGNRLLMVQQHQTGHTDNDVTVWDQRTGTLWASDTLFVDRVPSLDGSLPGWIEVMHTLGELSPTVVIPGHGKHGSWEALVAPQRRYLGKLLEQTRKVLAGNGRLVDAVESVAHDESAYWKLFESRHRGNVTKAFTELEWE